MFKYVDLLIKGDAPKNYQISTFSKHHDQVGEKLTELKNIIIKYCPAKANENLLNAALLISMLVRRDWNPIARLKIIFLFLPF